MNVTIIGVGNMARGIATRLLAGGNHVTLVGRNPDKTRALVDELRGAAKSGTTLSSAAFGAAVQDELVVLALPFPADVSVVKEYADKLQGKILVDICTPFNESYDALTTGPDTSAAEETAKAAGGSARVVKAFATNFARPLAAGQVAGQPLDVFVAGDDAPAKARVSELIASGGLRPLDAGPLSRARLLEGLHLLSVSVQSQMEKPWMNAIKIIS